MPSIPRAIGVDQVPQLLASIDRRTAIGLRDYAILLLLARLGLRSGEVGDYAILLLLARLGLRSGEVDKPIGVQGLATILGKWLPAAGTGSLETALTTSDATGPRPSSGNS